MPCIKNGELLDEFYTSLVSVVYSFSGCVSECGKWLQYRGYKRLWKWLQKLQHLLHTTTVYYKFSQLCKNRLIETANIK